MRLMIHEWYKELVTMLCASSFSMYLSTSPKQYITIPDVKILKWHQMTFQTGTCLPWLYSIMCVRLKIIFYVLYTVELKSPRKYNYFINFHWLGQQYFS